MQRFYECTRCKAKFERLAEYNGIIPKKKYMTSPGSLCLGPEEVLTYETICYTCRDQIQRRIQKILKVSRRCRTFFTGPEVKHLHAEAEKLFWSLLQEHVHPDPYMKVSSSLYTDEELPEKKKYWVNKKLDEKFGPVKCSVCSTRFEEVYPFLRKSVRPRMASKDIGPPIKRVCQECFGEIKSEIIKVFEKNK